ncbi:tetratricopeptide repeat protein [Aerolutibacter ruishenii]|uniref:Cytochrome c-type biogenesis protein CcmH n=1 Tax=Aerolutibacter ruishenii TaxID=686800 RepID=A0A562LY96_9GAMM|nr:tetratricopeptide repeat protein [Lysobacter ruishenii]TWI12619.1 cytochrome c-type biogenesis protein CcmH [Lysobacter ruishenii]
MSAFVVASLALVLMVLAYVLRPVFKAHRLTGVAMLASALVMTGALYFAVGTPRALDQAQRRTPQTLDEAITQLEAKLADDPSEIDGWRLLARAYTAQGRHTDARDALARAVTVAPDEADLLTDAAEARANADKDHRFDDKAVQMLRHALGKQPMHQRARWFLGIAQRQAGRAADAAKTWEPLLAIVEPNVAATLRPQINAARVEAGLPELAAPAPVAASGKGITVKVELADALRAKLPAGATLFVVAREPGGPPIPVAAEKVSAAQLPLELRLDDADSLMPTKKLSDLANAEISARLSITGIATPQAGDLEAAPVQTTTDAKAPVVLKIDRVRP